MRIGFSSEINDPPPRYSHLVRVFIISPDFIEQKNLDYQAPPPIYDDLFKDMIFKIPLRGEDDKKTSSIYHL